MTPPRPPHPDGGYGLVNPERARGSRPDDHDVPRASSGSLFPRSDDPSHLRDISTNHARVLEAHEREVAEIPEIKRSVADVKLAVTTVGASLKAWGTVAVVLIAALQLVLALYRAK